MSYRKSYKKWTSSEEELLIKRHGSYSIKSTAKKLNRSVLSVELKAYRLGLSGNSKAFDQITKTELRKALKITSFFMEKLINDKGLKVNKKITCKTKVYYFIELEEFWNWAEKHKSLIDWTKLEKNLLGKEPLWVDEERKQIVFNKKIFRYGNEWTKKEEMQLAELYNSGKACTEIALIMGRTVYSIRGKVKRLNTVKCKRAEWRVLEIKKLKEFIKQGLKNSEIAEKLGRSKNSIVTKKRELKKKGEL